MIRSRESLVGNRAHSPRGTAGLHTRANPGKPLINMNFIEICRDAARVRLAEVDPAWTP